MTRSLLSRIACVALIAAPTTASVAQVTFQLRTTIDGFTFSTGNPGSVAAYGDSLFVGSLFSGGVITRIDNPLTSPVSAGTLTGTLPLAGNGYVSLDTDGTTVVAASNNSGASDVVQVFDFTTGALRYEANPASLPGPGPGSASVQRIDGAAIDPITGNVWLTGFGGGLPTVLSANSLTSVSDNPSALFSGSPTGTGFRDINFDAATGDLYLRATNGVLGGKRVPASVDDFTTLNSLGATAGFSQIAGGDFATLQDSGQSALNIEFLPASFTGTEGLFITNTRVGAPASTPFGDQVRVFDADAGFDGASPFSLNSAGVPVSVTFLDSDGVTPFTTTGSTNGIYDFSFDPVNEVLWISDQSNGVIYAFSEPFEVQPLYGDYNNDGSVDAADYTVWRDNFGTPTTLPNDETPGTVDNGDYTVWTNNYGASSSSALTIPEPTALMLFAIAVAFGVTRRS